MTVLAQTRGLPPSRVAGRGSRFWCPSCKALVACATLDSRPTGESNLLNQRIALPTCRRVRACLACETRTTTYEISVTNLTQLVAAKQELEQLQRALKVLRILSSHIDKPRVGGVRGNGPAEDAP